MYWFIEINSLTLNKIIKKRNFLFSVCKNVKIGKRVFKLNKKVKRNFK